MNDPRYAEARAKLVSMSVNLPPGLPTMTSTGLANVPGVWVEQFGNILAVLEEVTGLSLTSFKPTTATRGEAYDRDILKTKIDAALAYLDERFPGGGSRPLGFRP